MRLVFDLSGTQRRRGQGVHGGGEYIKSVLVETLASRKDEDLVFVSGTRADDPEVMDLIGGLPLRRFRGSAALSQLLDELQPDVFFSGMPYAYGSVRLPVATRAVYTIHGLRELECPTDRYETWFPMGWKGRLRHALDSLFPAGVIAKTRNQFRALFDQTDEADVILAVSEHTRFSLLNHFGTPKAAVKVSYSPEKPGKPRGSAVGGPPYLLAVSGDRWIKNAIRAAFAFDALVSRMPERLGPLVLRITGGIPARAYRKLRNPERVILMGYQTGEGLESLYADALALLYPSLNEGFGYPPLEAMKYGTPVLSSAATSLTEVCGNAALYFDPRSIDEMQTRILAVLDSGVQKRLREAGLRRYAEISRQQNDDKLDVVKLLLGRAAR